MKYSKLANNYPLRTGINQKALYLTGVVILSFLVLFIKFDVVFASDKVLKIATSTSTKASGLTELILPVFENDHGYKAELYSVGTGRALRLGRSGKVDVLLVHAINEEKAFVEAG